MKNQLNLKLLLFLVTSLTLCFSCNQQKPKSKNQSPVSTEIEENITEKVKPVPVAPPPKKDTIVEVPKVIEDTIADIEPPEIPVAKPSKVFKGTATYYHDKFQGKPTASGEPYDRDLYTAAIRMNAMSLPFGTMVEVYSLKRDKKVRVKVNDKMSNRASGIIDLSYKAAEEIGLILDGRTKVEVRVVEE